MSDDKKKSEEKGYFSKLISGISSSVGYIGGGIYNIGKGIVHTVGGAVGLGPGMESGVNKIANGTSSIIDGVVQGSVESITGVHKDHPFSPDSDDLLRRYSAVELRQMAKDNPQECINIISNSFRMNDHYEDGLRYLKVIAPVVSEWKEEDQADLLNKFVAHSGMPKYVQRGAIETLFNSGVNPNIGKKTNINNHPILFDPVSPFYRLVTGYFYDPELLQLFLEHGADPSVVVRTPERGAISIYESAFDSKKKDLMSGYMNTQQLTGLGRLNQENITNEQSENNSLLHLNQKER